MIGFSGFYNFSRSKKIKNFYESRFINNLDLSLLKVEGPKVQKISFFLVMKNSYPNLNNSL